MMLSEDDWREIKALKLTLPDRARQEIDRWIDLEVRLRRSRQRPAVTRGKLKRLQDLTARLARELATIDGDVIGALFDGQSPLPGKAGTEELAALSPLVQATNADVTEIGAKTAAALAILKSIEDNPPERTPQPARHAAVVSLNSHLAQLDALAAWLQIAAERVKAGKRGPDGESHEWLARQCASFLERHNAGQLSRSYKAGAEAEFTKIVMRAAARIAGGQLVERGTGAIRRVARARGRINAKTS